MEPIDISKPVPKGMADHRDAIHIAIVAVTSESELRHGEPVALSEPGRNVVVPVPIGQHIGIITPFIGHVVPPGDLTWMMLNPGSITSLRHEWTHHAFENNSIDTARDWLESWASALGLPLGEILDYATRFKDYREYSWEEGQRLNEDDVNVPPEFWEHYEILKGVQVPDNRRRSFFTCSC